MRLDPRHAKPIRITQTGGVVASPVTSAVVFLPGTESGDAAGTSGSLVIAVKGSNASSCYVLLSASKCSDIEAGGGIWTVLQKSWETPFEDGIVVFTDTPQGQASLAVVQGTFSAIRLVSWDGSVTMEVST